MYLILIGFAGGLITGVSPCVLPVLPIVFFGSAPGDGPTRRPYRVIGGLVLSFTMFTLLGTLLVKALDLPDDILRVLGLIVVTVVGLSLLVPPLERRLERLFAKIPVRRAEPGRGGFGLGSRLACSTCRARARCWRRSPFPRPPAGSARRRSR